MSTIDIAALIAPKSDQLNAVDLVGGPVVVRITGLAQVAGDKGPRLRVDIEGLRPWMPSKGMIRILVEAWGADVGAWVGRYARLYREPSVTWSGEAVGGIQIHALSHLSEPLVTSHRINQRKAVPYRVEVLRPSEVSAPDPRADLLALLADAGVTLAQLDAATGEGKPRPSTLEGDALARMVAALRSPNGQARLASLAGGPDAP